MSNTKEELCDIALKAVEHIDVDLDLAEEIDDAIKFWFLNKAEMDAEFVKMVLVSKEKYKTYWDDFGSVDVTDSIIRISDMHQKENEKLKDRVKRLRAFIRSQANTDMDDDNIDEWVDESQTNYN